MTGDLSRRRLFGEALPRGLAGLLRRVQRARQDLAEWAAAAAAQVLLNNLNSIGFPLLQTLTVDGSYGPLTAGDVEQFQDDLAHGGGVTDDGMLGPQTWWWLCKENQNNGFTGSFWHDAGCATEGTSPPPA